MYLNSHACIPILIFCFVTYTLFMCIYDHLHCYQLGDGSRQSSRLPVQVLLAPLTEIEANTCELLSGGHHNVLQVKGEMYVLLLRRL